MTSPSKKPRFSIHLAIQNGETEFIEKLIYYNHLPGDINALDDSGLSPLHVAVLYKKVKIVKVLLKNGAMVNMLPRYVEPVSGVWVAITKPFSGVPSKMIQTI